jgi:UDP-3-O-[3-hydroxymyristoyl] glucosamine N-acyltransferase
MPSVGEIGRAIGATVIGNEQVAINRVASIGSASGDTLVFVEDDKNLAAALKSASGAVIAGTFAENATSSKPLLISVHPRLAFARAAAFIQAEVIMSHSESKSADRGARQRGIDPTAIVLPTATIGHAVTIDPWTFVGDGAVIGRDAWIGAGCVIGQGVVIGEACRVFPRVTLYPGTRLGNRVTVHAGAVLGSDGFGYVRDAESGRYEKFPQIGTLEIGDDVEIGANTTIDRGALDTTRIGRGAKIDNLVHIGHNCQIGENVIIAAQAGFSGSIVIEDNVVIGGQVGVGEHARIQEGVLLGGQAGVLPKKVLRGKGIAFWGTPAKPLREYLKSLAALAKLGRKEH